MQIKNKRPQESSTKTVTTKKEQWLTWMNYEQVCVITEKAKIKSLNLLLEIFYLFKIFEMNIFWSKLELSSKF